MDWAINEKSYTQRKACYLVGLEPKTYRYQSARPDDTGVRQRLKELASQRRRFGYRRLHLLLEREGIMMNWKKLYRLYREEKLTVRKRGGRTKTRDARHHRWPATSASREVAASTSKGSTSVRSIGPFGRCRSGMQASVSGSSSLTTLTRLT